VFYNSRTLELRPSSCRYCRAGRLKPDSKNSGRSRVLETVGFGGLRVKLPAASRSEPLVVLGGKSSRKAEVSVEVAAWRSGSVVGLD